MMAWFKKLGSSRHPGLLAIFVTTGVSMLISVWFTIRGNPEIEFWAKAAQQKVAWRDKLADEEIGPVTIVFGGSSTAFGIDAGYATEKLGYPIVNLGLHAGMGAETITGFALSQVRKGDTLLVMLEPVLLGKGEAVPALGVQFAAAIGKPEILAWREPSMVHPLATHLGSLRPGASETLSLFGKIVLSRPLYRYQLRDMKRGGLLVTNVGGNLAGVRDPILPLKHSDREFFQSLVEISQERGFHLRYALPLNYTEAEFAEDVRLTNQRLLTQIAEIMPVVWEDHRGVSSMPEDFSDSPRHLTAEAAIRRTRDLVAALRRE